MSNSVIDSLQRETPTIIDPACVTLLYEIAARTNEWRTGRAQLREVDEALDRLRDFEVEKNGNQGI